MPVRGYQNAWLGERIRALRVEEPFMSQETLAELCHLDAPYISRIERGERTPSTGNLVAIADALECSVDFLLGRTKEVGVA